IKPSHRALETIDRWSLIGEMVWGDGLQGSVIAEHAATPEQAFIFLRAEYSTHKRFVLGGEECAAPFSSETLINDINSKRILPPRYDDKSMTLRPDCQKNCWI